MLTPNSQKIFIIKSNSKNESQKHKNPLHPSLPQPRPTNTQPTKHCRSRKTLNATQTAANQITNQKIEG